MAGFIAPVPKQHYHDDNGVLLNGGKLYIYVAGSSTLADSYQEEDLVAKNTNPIVLNARGETPYGIYLAAGTYKFILKNADETQEWEQDVVSGINDITTSVSEWVALADVPTYQTTTKFSVPGDQTLTFEVARPIRCTVSAGTVYGAIIGSTYTGSVTTVSVRLQSGVLDSGISDIAVGLTTYSGVPTRPIASSGHMAGLVCTNNAVDAAHDIDISVGETVDSTGQYLMHLDSVLTKHIDGPFNNGTDLGGMFTGSVAADTTYYMFLIRRDSDGLIDAGWDTSLTAANIPSGWTAYRLIDALITDGSANIIPWTALAMGKDVRKELLTSIQEWSTAPPTANKSNTVVTAPTGFPILAHINAVYGYAGAGFAWIRSPYFTDAAASITNFTHSTAAGATSASIVMDVMTDDGARISLRASVAGTMFINLAGYTLFR
jgi:hypothetical protein